MAPGAYILIIFLLLCAEGTNINGKLSQFNHGTTFSIEGCRPKNGLLAIG